MVASYFHFINKKQLERKPEPRVITSPALSRNGKSYSFLAMGRLTCKCQVNSSDTHSHPPKPREKLPSQALDQSFLPCVLTTSDMSVEGHMCSLLFLPYNYSQKAVLLCLFIDEEKRLREATQ